MFGEPWPAVLDRCQLLDHRSKIQAAKPRDFPAAAEIPMMRNVDWVLWRTLDITISVSRLPGGACTFILAAVCSSSSGLYSKPQYRAM